MNRIYRLLVFCLLFCSGCSLPSSFVETLPDTHLLVELNDAELFAVRPDGEMIAYVDEGLNILRLADRYQQRLTYDNPEALIWAPDGLTLVAAFREVEKTRLVRLTANSDDRPQILVDERITDFAWLTDGRLLAMAQTNEDSSSGSGTQVGLLIWDGQWDVERIPLYKMNFYSPSSATDFDLLHYFDVSPLKDELIYSRFLDPPVLNGRVELVLHNLLTGKEKVLIETDNRQAEAFCAADAERVLLPDGRGQVLFTNPWNKKVTYRWQSPGESLQIAPQRELFYLDGNLYAQDRLQLKLPARAKVRFSDDAERLFVAWQRKLYLYSGYQVPEKIEFTGVEKVKLQRIRQQRSRGEINLRDYYQARNNILNP